MKKSDYLLGVCLGIVLVYLGIVSLIGEHLPLIHRLIFTISTIIIYILILKNNITLRIPMIHNVRNLIITILWNLCLMEYINNVLLSIVICSCLTCVGGIVTYRIYKNIEDSSIQKKGIIDFMIYILTPTGLIIFEHVFRFFYNMF